MVIRLGCVGLGYKIRLKVRLYSNKADVEEIRATGGESIEKN